MLKMALGVAADDRGDSLNPEGVVESDVDACGPAIGNQWLEDLNYNL